MANRHVRPASTILVACLIAASSCTTSSSEPEGSSAAASNTAGSIDVCPDGCAFTQLAPALEVATDGDTITLAAGTYDGGVLIETSITLRGAGPDDTVISGGGPVITIGRYGAETSPTVTLEGLTLTGGVTTSWPGEDTDGSGYATVEARGGGILIPPGADDAIGADVALIEVVVTGNRVAPVGSVDSGFAKIDGVPLPYAAASGGGIDNWGNLRLERSIVSGNLTGAAADLSEPGMASDAQGGGIFSHVGDLVIIESEVTDNIASSMAPNGRWAEAGGIMQEEGTLTITDSVISDNTARLDAAYPADVEMLAQPGGLFVGEGVTSATITATRIVGNAAIMTNSVGDATAFSAGVNTGAELTVEGSEISRNEVYAATVGDSGGDASADTGGGTLLGDVVDTVVEGNTVAADSRAGDAVAAVGGLLVYGTLDGSRLEANEVRSVARQGEATAWGGGLMVAWGTLTLHDTVVTRNVVTAAALSGWARGGGIYDGPNPWDIDPENLTLLDSSITGNRLASPVAGFTVEGGGIYLHGPSLSSDGTTLTGNAPDGCVGCS